VEFRVLGPVEVWADGERLALGGDRQRTLLALLVLQANRVVPADGLMAALWPTDPSTSARARLHDQVFALRRVLRRGEPDASNHLVTRPPGYALQAEPDRVDHLRFADLVRCGRQARAAGDPAAAVEHLRAALALWRGPALGGTDGDGLAGQAQRLEEARLAAVEDCVDAELARGAADEVIPELTALVAAHPLRERPRGQLMLALYRVGRQAEALEVWRDTRRRLQDELGLDPGPDLDALRDRILRNDPSLIETAARPGNPVAPSAGPGPSGPTPPLSPRGLPANVAGFVGRRAELAALDHLVPAGPGGDPTAMPIAVVSGTAGVGKTTLAVHWSHRVADRFPDGQLFVDLRGYDPDQPLAAADVLAVFLRALGVRGSAVPVDVDERAALYRSVLAGRRVLVVLDNAADYDHLRPLLPGSATCVVLVTSRDATPALGVRHGALRVDLDLLPADEAVDLLARRAGERVTRDPAGAAALAQRCAHLPLALCVAAEYLAYHPEASLASLTMDLAEADHPLDMLEAGGEWHTAVRSVLSWSYRALPAPVARAFRLVGAPVTADVDRHAAAALLDEDARTTGRLLDHLVRAHLIRDAPPGRYGMHDLLRAYAREKAETADGPERHAAHRRLAEHYLAATSAAMEVLAPHESGRRATVPPPSRPLPPLDGEEAARAWLDANRANLITMVAYTVDHGLPEMCLALSDVLRRYLDTGGYHHEATQVHGCAVRAATLTGDRLAEANARRMLAVALCRLGLNRDAVAEARRTLEIYRAAGDEAGEAGALNGLGVFYWLLGDDEQAFECLTRAYGICLDRGERLAAAVAMGNLAGLLERRGRYEKAIGLAEQTLATFAEIGDRLGVARTLGNMGSVYGKLGRHEEALDHYRRSLADLHELGSRAFVGAMLGGIARAQVGLGRHAEAIETGRQAVAATRETGDRKEEAEVRNALGDAYRRMGHPDDARREHSAALAIARDIDDRYQVACALDGLAQAEQAAEATEVAREHWLAALEIFDEMQVPEADAVRARLRQV
jgi:DNA-binding SARP family transcriptional activator/tetratricopeptide (TPR) repeat protein